LEQKGVKYPINQVLCVCGLVSISEGNECEIGREEVAEKPYKNGVDFDEIRGDEKYKN
jgi:hypothetical protein